MRSSGGGCACGGEPAGSSTARSSRSKSRSKSRKGKSKCFCGANANGRDQCPDCETSRNGLSCRLQQIKSFGEMVFDERRFICFVKRLHITLGRCFFSYLLSLCCILERINWVCYLDGVRYFIQQNEFIENALDQCCFFESVLIEWITAPCACGDCSHYTLLILLSPLLFIVGLLSLVLSVLLKFKRLLFGERCICGDPMPKTPIGLGVCTSAKCMCGGTGGQNDEVVVPPNEASVRTSIKRISMNIPDGEAQQPRTSRRSSASRQSQS